MTMSRRMDTSMPALGLPEVKRGTARFGHETQHTECGVTGSWLDGVRSQYARRTRTSLFRGRGARPAHGIEPAEVIIGS